MAIIGNKPGKYSQISIAWFCEGIKDTILSISLLVTSIFWQRIMWEEELSPLDHLFKELNPILEETRQQAAMWTTNSSLIHTYDCD